jgi:allophanate hydrolase subunit 2
MYLKGPAIKNNMKHDMMSEGIVKGAIQITPNGKTVVLLSDHGTTGGYPKIAVVCDEDYEKLAQMPFNHQFNFILE